MHNHQNHPSNQYKSNDLKDMKKYFNQIKKQNHVSSCSIPCGPVLKCVAHSSINCILAGCGDQSNYQMQWYCNTNTKYHQGNSIFLIWDAKNAWLPGIWFKSKKYDEYIQ